MTQMTALVVGLRVVDRLQSIIALLGTLSALRDLAIIAQNESGARHDHENEYGEEGADGRSQASNIAKSVLEVAA